MDISYTSKLFSLKHCEEYKLSIQADLNGFSFCVYDFSKNTYLLLKHFSFDVNENIEYFIKELNRIIESEELFSHTFRQVDFLYFTPNSTIIPQELLNEHDAKEYFLFQHKLEEYDELHIDSLSRLKSSVVHSIPSALTNIFLNKFANISYKNQYTVITNLAEDILIKNNLSQLCLIHKSTKFFDIVVFQDKKLKLCNSFAYKTSNDLVYYTISTLRNLGISDSDTPVYYSGDFQSKEADTLMLRRFIKVLKVNEPYQIKRENNLDLFDSYPIHYFTPLYFLNY